MPTLGIGGFISGIIFSFIYNKIYINELLVKGYKPANETAKNILTENSIISA